MKELLKIFPSLLIFFILGCSVSEPYIKDIRWDIKNTRNIESGKYYESLSLFILVRDEDGSQDIKELYIIEDTLGIRWELDNSNWSKSSSEYEVWLGANDIKMPDNYPIPREKIRVFVRDRAGKSFEEKIYITEPKRDLYKLKYPELIFNENRVTVSNFAECDLIIQKYDGSVIRQKIKEDGYILEPGIKSIWAFAFDNGVLTESGPWTPAI